MNKFILRHFFQNENQVWTFFAQIIRIISGLIFVAIITRSLSTELLATWYTFIAIFGLVTICEMGMSTVYSRHFAYICADNSGREPPSIELFNLFKKGEKIYYYLSIFILTVAILFGTLMLYSKYNKYLNLNIVILWIFYSCGGALSILSLYYVAVINGMGKIGRGHKLSIISLSINSGIIMTLFLFENTLVIPVVAYLISQIVACIIYRREVRSYSMVQNMCKEKIINNNKITYKIRSDTLKTLVGIVAYQGLTNGFFLILSRYYSHKDIAAYGLTMQFTGIVTSLSMIWASTAFYEMAANHGKEKDLETLSIFMSSLIKSSMVCFIGLLGVYYLGPVVLKILGSKSVLFENNEMAILLCGIWFEFNYGLVAQLLISQGLLQVSYIAVVGAIAVCFLTYILAINSNCDLICVFIGRFTVAFSFIFVPYLILLKKNFKLKLIIYGK